MDFENQNNENVRLCDLCGERPAAVDVMFVAGGERRHGGVCEQCARDAMTQQQLGGGGPLGAAPINGPFPGAGPNVRQRQNTRQRSETPALDRFGRDLTGEARNGRIDPVIGRESEIEQVVEALSRRRKNNAALIGEAGVGQDRDRRGPGAADRQPGRSRAASVTCAWSRSTWPGWSPAPSSAAPSSSG